MSENHDIGASPPDRSYPPPPPVDAPTADDSGGSVVLGLVLGLVGTALGAFGPFFVFPEGGGLVFLWLLPLVLVVGIALTVKGSTRRTGVGMLLGWAVGLLVSAGTCLYLLSTLGVG